MRGLSEVQPFNGADADGRSESAFAGSVSGFGAAHFWSLGTLVLQQILAHMKITSTKLLMIVLTIACARAAFAIDVSVDAHCNIFGAGHPPPNDAPSVGSNGGGVAPVLISLTALGNPTTLQFKATGSVSYCPSCGANGPDGGDFLTAAPSYNGISGITNFPARSLVAVFTSDTEPANPAPTPLDFALIGTNYAALTPQLRQIFYVGDGFTATNTAQVISVPAGTTKLYLGLIDGDSYEDTPDAYNDNSGAFSVTVSSAALALGIEYSTGKPGISIFGPVGSSNRVEYVTALPATNWIALTNIVLTGNPTFLYDTSSSGDRARFYRALQWP